MNRHPSLFLAVLASAAVLAACGEAPPAEPANANGRPVKLIEIEGTTDEITARYPAVIGAGEQADLSFLVGGIILELPVDDSDDVVEGDLIARLDPRDFESNLASARASFSNAEDEYQRAVRLAEQDAIAQSVLEQRKTQRDVAKAQLDSAEKALADSVLRAPFSGIVASIPVREQQTVSPGTAIATLIDVTTLDATFNLPASVIARVPTREEPGVFVILDAAPNEEIEAVFSEANLVADATSQTYAVTFSFEPPETLLVLPGMNATVEIRGRENGTVPSNVAVPLAAVQSDGSGQYVWIVDGDSMTVARRDIEVAPGIGETVVVTAGLTSGDQIVGAGGAYLAEGLKVTPWTE